MAQWGVHTHRVGDEWDSQNKLLEEYIERKLLQDAVIHSPFRKVHAMKSKLILILLFSYLPRHKGPALQLCYFTSW